MSANRTNQLLQTGANIGILLGLILVGVQISETNRIANAQFIAEEHDATMASFDLRIGESLPSAWGKASSNMSNLSGEDHAIVQAFLMREWYRSMRDRDVSLTGLKERNFESEVVRWTFTFLGNETSLRWWAGSQDGFLNQYPEFRDAINDRLAIEGTNHSQFHIESQEMMKTGQLFPVSVSDQFLQQ